ncbi:hypothetical protein NKR23_g3778 [Pleurostoma richardsiae]|uniref:Uncharacterized protein n=1 Tax=Pleurostoma richardsiae TaxID=41990 RepID=A0AA38VTB9_9PEZI|nr:hypothetical protein NKR23_g3778 [Pleurostoma richardsiae]
MLPSTHSTPSRPVAVVGLTCLALLCLISFGEGFKILGTHDSVTKRAHSPSKRNVDSERGSSPVVGPDDSEKFGIPGLPISIPPIIPVPSATAAAAATTAAAGGAGILNPLLSILGGVTSAVPVPLPAATGSGAGGLPIPLLALSSLVPLPEITSLLASLPVPVTPPAVLPSSSAAAADPLGGLGDALGGILGGGAGGGLLDQITASLLAPLASIVADVPAVINDPVAAVGAVQEQVATILDNIPALVTAVPAVVSGLESQLTEVVAQVPDILTAAPDLVGGLQGEVAGILTAVPDIVTALPAAVLSVAAQVGDILSDVPLASAVVPLLTSLEAQVTDVVVNVLPIATSVVGALGDQVVSLLPAPLASVVAPILSSDADAFINEQLTEQPSKCRSFYDGVLELLIKHIYTVKQSQYSLTGRDVCKRCAVKHAHELA